MRSVENRPHMQSLPTSWIYRGCFQKHRNRANQKSMQATAEYAYDTPDIDSQISTDARSLVENAEMDTKMKIDIHTRPRHPREQYHCRERTWIGLGSLHGITIFLMIESRKGGQARNALKFDLTQGKNGSMGYHWAGRRRRRGCRSTRGCARNTIWLISSIRWTHMTSSIWGKQTCSSYTVPNFLQKNSSWAGSSEEKVIYLFS